MADKKADKKIDPRSPEEIATAQKALVKILAIATGIPVAWVTMLSVNALTNSADAASAPGGAGVFWFYTVWGVMSPVVWLVTNGYTWKQINDGNMDAGRFMPMVPALWIIFWFIGGMIG